MRKGQVSVEMIILLSALLILLMGFISTFSSASDRSYLSRRAVSAREFSERLSYGINNVYLTGDDAETEIELPETLIDNTNYSISIYPSQHILEISWRGRQDMERHQVQLLTGDISGNISGIYGTVRLFNANGTVVMENIH